jgi:hypothetical protein
MAYDAAFARISVWLIANGLTAHTDIKGRTVLRDKQTGAFVRKL